MKCYKIVFEIKSLIKNQGFYLISFIIILYFITLFIFITKSFKVLKKEILNIFSAKRSNKIHLDNNIIKYGGKIEKNKNRRNKEFIQNNKTYNQEDKTYQKLDSKWINKSKIKNFNYLATQNIDNTSQRINPKTDIINDSDNTIINNAKNILNKKDFELNSLCYESAIKLDHRTYIEYYISLLKNNYPIIFSFVPFDDYNSKIIKIFLFFFLYSLDLTVNALFFTDDTMNKIYQDKGKFNFLYQIPQILYSALISKLLDSIIKNFALTKENIVQFKEKKEKSELYIIYKKFISKLKIKYILYFVLTFIVLLFFWFYDICFCGIYINTQSHITKDSLISEITSLLIPLALYLLPGIFRISALRAEKPSRKFLYKFSIFLENLLI